MSRVRLNRRMSLEEWQPVPDGMGGLGGGWVERGVLWAHLVPGSGREAGSQGVVTSAQSARLLVRAAPPGAASRPRPGMRLREGTRVFALLAVTEHLVDGRYLVCTAREEVAA